MWDTQRNLVPTICFIRLKNRTVIPCLGKGQGIYYRFQNVVDHDLFVVIIIENNAYFIFQIPGGMPCF
jgi:hypothetical protein